MLCEVLFNMALEELNTEWKIKSVMDTKGQWRSHSVWNAIPITSALIAISSSSMQQCGWVTGFHESVDRLPHVAVTENTNAAYKNTWKSHNSTYKQLVPPILITLCGKCPLCLCVSIPNEGQKAGSYQASVCFLLYVDVSLNTNVSVVMRSPRWYIGAVR